MLCFTVHRHSRVEKIEIGIFRKRVIKNSSIRSKYSVGEDILDESALSLIVEESPQSAISEKESEFKF